MFLGLGFGVVVGVDVRKPKKGGNWT